MRVAVFGATGLLGQHTAHAVVAAGHELVVIHRASSKLSRLGPLPCVTFCAELADEAALTAALRQVDAVVHCAAYVPGQGTVISEVARARAQMQQFCGAAARATCKVVVVGAASALPRQPQGLLADETLRYVAEPRGSNVFVRAKWAIEAEALSQAELGLPLVIGIPSMALGEYDHGPSAGRLVLGIANRSLPGYVRGRRSVMYAGDAGRGLLACVERGRSGERYLLTCENLTMDELVRKIAREAEAPVPRAIPLPLARGLAWLQGARFRFGGPAPNVTEAALQVIARGQFVSGDKARQELGFVAQTSVGEAIARALGWFAAQGMLSAVPHVS